MFLLFKCSPVLFLLTGVREIQEAVLVAFKNVAGVDFVSNVVEAAVIAVGHDSIGQLLKSVEVVYNFAAEECSAVFEGGFVDDYFGTLSFYALHDSLN